MSRRNAGAGAVARTVAESREWLQAADILLAGHRTRRLARRWIRVARRRYPGCTVFVSRQRDGRWCLVGLPDGVSVLLVCDRRWTPAEAARVGRIAYESWLLFRPQWSEEESVR